MLNEKAFQDYFPNNVCFGCGPSNPGGLHIKSMWLDEEKGATLCVWKPGAHHTAATPHTTSGVILGALVDCHAIWTAIANEYRLEDRPFHSDPLVWYVTGEYKVRFMLPINPTPPLYSYGEVVERSGKKRIIQVRVFSEGEERIRGEVIALPPKFDQKTIKHLSHHPTKK